MTHLLTTLLQKKGKKESFQKILYTNVYGIYSYTNIISGNKRGVIPDWEKFHIKKIK